MRVHVWTKRSGWNLLLSHFHLAMMVCRKKYFFRFENMFFFAYPSRFFTLADMKVTVFFTENFFISNVDIIELWAVLITEDGSFKLKALMDACADVDTIGRVEKFCFYLPNVHNMFFFLIDCDSIFLRLPTRLIRVSKIHVGFLVLRKVECVLTYIFLHRVHMCFRVHTHRTVWVSTFSTAMGKTRCWIKRATLERVTVSKWKHIPSYRNIILMRCGKYRFFTNTQNIFFHSLRFQIFYVNDRFLTKSK